jgi:hypothetical protein
MALSKQIFQDQRENELSKNLKLISDENIITNNSEHRDYQKRNFEA